MGRYLFFGAGILDLCHLSAQRPAAGKCRVLRARAGLGSPAQAGGLAHRINYMRTATENSVALGRIARSPGLSAQHW